MEFVEELTVGGKGDLKYLSNFFIGGFGVDAVVAFQDAPGVGVHYENRVFAGVEENGVGGFRADAAHAEELIAHNGGWSVKQAGE
jgi:hypothetical protein